MQLKSGDKIGRYEVREEMGQGGMSVVYKSFDTVLERFVAIKVIQPNQQQSEKFLRRFQREAKTLAQLSHPSIVKILDNGLYEGVPYLVMEFVTGGGLNSRMGKAYPYAEAAAILAPVARALQHAHERKVIHRDVKPANILINESGQPMLSDFGIVKLLDMDETQGLTSTGAMIGTPAYMSPEQASGKPVDGRSDIYSLGLIFYELVTGRKPFTANTPVELTLKHIQEPVPRPKNTVRDLPQEADQVILKSLAKSPDERYQNMAAFAAALEKLAESYTKSVRIGAAIEQKPETALPKPKGKFHMLAVGAVVGIVALALAVFFLTQQPPAAPLEPTANAETVVSPAEIQAETPTQPLPTETPIPPTPTPEPSPTPEDTPTPEPTQGAVFSENRIQVSNLDKLIQLSWVDKVSVIDLDWTNDGRWIAVSGSKIISLINPDTMRVEKFVSLGEDVPDAMTLSWDGSKAYVLSNNRVRVYELETGKEIQNFTFQGGVNSLAVSPDESLLALGLRDNKVLLVDAKKGNIVRTLRSNYGGWSVAFSPDGAYIAAGTSQGVLMWETATGTWLPINTGQNALVMTISFSPDGSILAGGGKGFVYLWDPTTGDQIRVINDPFGSLYTLNFSPDHALLLGASEDQHLYLWNLENGKEVWDARGHQSPVFGADFSPDGEYFVSGANEGYVRLWGMP